METFAALSRLEGACVFCFGFMLTSGKSQAFACFANGLEEGSKSTHIVENKKHKLFFVFVYFKIEIKKYCKISDKSVDFAKSFKEVQCLRSSQILW